MKLYYTPGTCSFAAHIVLRELGLPVELQRVRIGPNPSVVADGRDFRELSPLGYVPVLQLDDDRLLREGVAILSHLGRLDPSGRLAPEARRDDLLGWLTYIATELHKTYSPWLFHPEYGDQPGTVARQRLQPRLALVDRHLATQPYLLGADFSIADAYLFTIADWSRALKLPLDDTPHLAAYLERIRARPSVTEALQAERAPQAQAVA
ncbi:glutathione binding-like protein [Lysobacter sp. 5GHs7-4]|uniref:glutathione binding-like protein n=1 Tax=Lysobacter sp. 5GHs7-4 TaxID=2904253 RepID=UPI001E4BB6AA|nr:glutathione binding-like protein [Lysobacter sp. 5GHs7-4]UHQ23807.1 glutathione binding-like protein [Lysobacter sp. 5GHs7-4]